jgi:large subunit ribosomal protein L1
MSYAPNQLEEIISQAKSEGLARRKRKFDETVEISIGLRDLDLKNPANRINVETVVPNDLGGNVKITVISDGDLAVKAKELGLRNLGRQDVEMLAKETKKAKILANETDFFLTDPPLMAIVGRFLGKILGPRGKMPKPIPPKVDLAKFIERYNRIIPVRLKASPVINTKIGKVSQDTKALAENASAIIQTVTSKLPKGTTHIRNLTFKTTMGPSVKFVKK